MRRFACVVLAATAALALAQPALAQDAAPVAHQLRRAPAIGMVAVGADIGFFVPTGDLDVGAAFGGFAEFYLVPRVAIRGRVGTADTGFTTTDASQRRLYASVDLLYNWEGGLWHPFVAVGVGALQARLSAGGLETRRTRAMVSVGGGAEYFVRQRVTVKFEAAYQRTGDMAGIVQPSGYTLSAGLARYF